jgi:S-adenosylmethionine decarboxylase
MCESQNTDMFFEGVEKLLEIWFTANAGAGNACGDLRKIPRMELENLLETVKCKIISSRKNDNIDAYVLSESSMFISKRRFVLKTCGTTTPLLCLDALFKLVKEYAGFEKVEDFFYSRKNYKRPELQIGPHQNFQQEVAILDQFFPDGAAYCFGAVNKDCWYLYTLNPLPEPINLKGLSIQPEPDQTLEILMTNLDPQVMEIFTEKGSKTAEEATMKSGIDKIIPNMIIDDYLFEICGYSMNGIAKNVSNTLIRISRKIHLESLFICGNLIYVDIFMLTNYSL